MDYKTAGVDVDAGRAFINRIKSSVESTHGPEVLGGLGGFGGLIRLPAGIRNPLLVAGTDGVGTKLELAQEHQAHHGVGIDLVAMCVNDVITSGAQPLFFLDYIATGALSPDAMAEVVDGIAAGCRSSGCALLGGETAEMPGFYPAGRYDLAGFCVAVVEETELIDGTKISEGDQIIGVASSGIHSNGFSLVRKVLAMHGAGAAEAPFGMENTPLIKTLLTPTTIYVPLVQALLKAGVAPHAMAHITGGGLPENLPRCLPSCLGAVVDPSSWQRPPVFEWLQEVGQIPEPDLWNTFNLGVGFCLVVAAESAEDAIQICRDNKLDAWQIGRVEACSSSDGQRLRGLPC
ncbi:MAG: phosphoribosylformylglycinamidine cyclo-ligase [Prochlorococcus sp.]